MKRWFQSTHPRGVRLACSRRCVLSRECFNPRTRGGCDLRRLLCSQHCPHVSIHAPAGGATDQIEILNPNDSSFNPRTRGGCDRACQSGRIKENAFQSTHPRGVRPTWLPMGFLPLCFNPRTRGGCDIAAKHAPQPNEGFNPRTRGGCDPASVSHTLGLVSIHAPAGGATMTDTYAGHITEVSIHAPAGGATT
jgi:hypothetical protein